MHASFWRSSIDRHVLVPNTHSSVHLKRRVMDSQVSVASSTVDSQLSEDWNSDDDDDDEDEDLYDDYYGRPA